QPGNAADSRPADLEPGKPAAQRATETEGDATEDNRTSGPADPIQSTAESDHAPQSGDYIGDLAAAGYTNLTVDQLIELKMHGVTPDFIKEMNALVGNKLPVDTLVAMKIHGVTAAFAKELKDLGFANLSAEQLVAFRIHGLTPQYYREMKA